ncbi:eCIS core domain-containing protein [Haliangium sp.]|uniref:eCIS core domain-containing protein n=1 Tax=Haliangium sp. TaxID=2663208 RepID=UPI003D0DD4E4
MSRDHESRSSSRQDSRTAERSESKRVSPGKVTRSGRLGPAGSAPVQRKAAAAGTDAGQSTDKTAWEWTNDPRMDAAHRGNVSPGLFSSPVQAKGEMDGGDSEHIHRAASAGVSGSGSTMPHLQRIQQSFGPDHDVSQVQAHVGGAAAEANAAIGASAYATGNHVAFHSTPDVHTAAHEAAHVIQQQQGVQLQGGVGQVGDAYERHADAVADRVVSGQSAADLLSSGPGGSAPAIGMKRTGETGGVQMSRSWGQTGSGNGASLWGNPNSRAVQFDKTKGAGAEAAKGAGAEAEAKKGGDAKDAPVDPVEAKKAAEEAKKLAEFKKKTYSQKDHVPSTGYGAFDVEYVPMGGALNITVRTDFQFKDSAKAKWANNTGLVGAVERVINQAVWIAQYQAHIAARWGGQYTMNCVKKYWDSLTANTNVNVVQDSANPHFRLKIVKMPPGKHHPGSAIDVPSTWAYKNYKQQQPGANPAWGGTLNGELGSTDVTELERDVGTASAKTVEPDRMRAHMPKKVLFEDNKAEVSAKDATQLKTFGTMLSMTRHPQLTVNMVGRASSSGDDAHNLDLSKRRVAAVDAAIRAGGNITHNLSQSATGEAGAGAGAEWRRVDLSIENLPKKWTNDYDVSAHEFGHQLGLDEEYNRGASGVVPDHFKLVEEAFGKEVASTFVRQDQDTASVMSAGLDVRPFHYVTFWEALGRVTSPTLTRADWKIQA